jgi:hypothetical protein
VVELSAGPFSDAGVAFDNQVSGPVFAVLDGPFLGQALAQLFKSLRAEVAPGGVLRLTLEEEESWIRLIVSLEGELRPQGDDWLATGMGFWVARYAVQEHGGRFEEGQAPSRFVHLILPKEPQ